VIGVVPRSNRPRRAHRIEDRTAGDIERLRAGWRRTETRADGEWSVQPMSAANAVKAYSCPGCGRTIAAGTAHVVTWRTDGVLGEAADLQGRRHWHTGCWGVRR